MRKVHHKKVHTQVTGCQDEETHFSPLWDFSYKEVEKEMFIFLERLVEDINIKR